MKMTKENQWSKEVSRQESLQPILSMWGRLTQGNGDDEEKRNKRRIKLDVDTKINNMM